MEKLISVSLGPEEESSEALIPQECSMHPLKDPEDRASSCTGMRTLEQGVVVHPVTPASTQRGRGRRIVNLKLSWVT